MPLQYELSAESDRVEVRGQGDVRLSDFLEMENALQQDPEYRPGMAALFDLRMITTSLSLDDIRRLGIGRQTDPLFGRLAVVVHPGLTFGLARQFMGFAGDDAVNVFTEIGAAEVWLARA